jgi:hypothetical protein
LPPGADDRRVEGLVHVELRHRDVVLEPARQRVPARMQGAQGGVTVADRVHQDPDAHEVVDVVEVLVPDDHLLVDRVIVLGPTGDRGLDPCRPQIVGDLVPDHAEALFALRRAVAYHADDFLVHLGIERRERQVLELPLDGVHAEAVRQGREDLQGFPGFAGRRLGGDETPRARVVQPVRELDHQDPDVLGHGNDHLADGLRLGCLAEADLVQLGDAVDQHGDFGAEVRPEVLKGVGRVLHGVVEQRRRQGGTAEPQLGEDRRDGNGMGDVGITALALLPSVALLRDHKGALDEVEVFLGVVRPHGPQQRLQNGRVCRGAAARQACQAGPRALTPARESGPDAGVVHRHPGRRAPGSHQTSLLSLARTVASGCRWRRRRTFFQ